jgi:hypothetical protein
MRCLSKWENRSAQTVESPPGIPWRATFPGTEFESLCFEWRPCVGETASEIESCLPRAATGYLSFRASQWPDHVEFSRISLDSEGIYLSVVYKLDESSQMLRKVKLLNHQAIQYQP